MMNESYEVNQAISFNDNPDKDGNINKIEVNCKFEDRDDNYFTVLSRKHSLLRLCSNTTFTN